MSADWYTSVFRAAAFPLLDRLNGTTIAPKLAALLERERLSREEIAGRQDTELARVVQQAGRNSEFYRRFWQQAAGTRALPSLYPALDGLPVLTKADLAASPGAFPLPAYTGKVIATHTSGSTGRRMTFYRSVEQESWFWALRFRMWSWSGYRPGDPYLEINLNPRTAWVKRWQDLLFRCSYLTYNADNLDARRIVGALARHRIPHLNGFASSLFALAGYMIDNQLPNPSVKGITSTGDTLYPAYRETIETAFGARVLDYYGAGGEGFHLASQCAESGHRYHLHPENAVVEILGSDGPVPAGTPGRVVVTQLHNEAMPLIRYELGDVAAAAPDGFRCPCGRTLPLLERVEGRIPDLVVSPGGSFLVPHFFVVLFKNIEGISRYQIVQEERTRIRVRLVSTNGTSRRQIESLIRRQVGAATRGRLHTEFEWVDDIPLSGAGKRRLVISRISRERLSGAAAEQRELLSA